MSFSSDLETIFIIGGDPVIAYSQKCLLETQDHFVKLIKPQKYLTEFKMHNPNHIVILDVNAEKPKELSVLNGFLQRRERPKLLITTHENQVFEKDDFLPGGPWRFLFKPYQPEDLMSAVFQLKQSTYA